MPRPFPLSFYERIGSAGNLEAYVPRRPYLKDWDEAVWSQEALKNILSPRDYIPRLKEEIHEKNPQVMSYAWEHCIQQWLVIAFP